MKRHLFKILTITICIVTILNFVLPNVATIVYADTTAGQQDENSAVEVIEGAIGGIADGIVGLLTWPLRILIVAFGYALRLVIGGIASIAGGQFNINISPQDILFDKLEITDVNFFSFTRPDGSELSAGVLTIRQNIAIWYYALRNLAIGILLAVLVYVGIRMAISTVASEEAKYKTMLKDWVVSFVLVFLLQYIIAFTLNANNALVNIMENAMGNVDKNSIFSDIMDTFALQGVNPISFTMGFGSAIAFCILVGVTLSFLVFYIKRMLTLAFLVIISPIVTITYSIDKMGDNQSQALNKWIKEFVYTVLIQPFQCLIYIVFATTALDLMQDKTLGAAILGCIMLLFIHQAEHIVRGIFSFEHAHNLGDTFMTLALVKSLGSSLSKIGQSAAGGSGGRAAGAAPGGGGAQTPRQTNQARNNTNSNNNISKGFNKGRKQIPVLTSAKRGAQKLANTKAGKLLGTAQIGRIAGLPIRGATGTALSLAKLAPKLAFTAMGAGAGGMNGAIIGYSIGKGTYTAGKNIVDNVVAKRDEKTVVRTQTGQAYANWVQANGYQNDLHAAATGYERIARGILQGQDVNTFAREDQQLAQSLAQYRNSFEQMGISQQNIAKDMEKTLQKMQDLQRNNGGGTP